MGAMLFPVGFGFEEKIERGGKHCAAMSRPRTSGRNAFKTHRFNWPHVAPLERGADGPGHRPPPRGVHRSAAFIPLIEICERKSPYDSQLPVTLESWAA